MLAFRRWASGIDPVAAEFARLARHRLGDRIRSVILFGSRARGDAHENSDYDIVVVVDRRSTESRATLLDITVDLLERHGRLVACLLRDEREWEALRAFPLGSERRPRGVAL